ESVIGSVFEARYEPAVDGRAVLPFITGRAHVTLDAQVVIDPADPFAWGLGG
ncbi:MAG: proline racemase family protein, partial [Burkholderiaceae bacterium]|nr:proline racemase family protein [Burkholderiaceae bacterium]